jgi:hypothetical protein
MLLLYIDLSLIMGMSCSVIPVFRQQAEQLLSSSTLSAADLLAKALAKAVVSCFLVLHFQVSALL